MVNAANVGIQDAPNVVKAGIDKVVNTGAVMVQPPVRVVKFVNVMVVTAGMDELNTPPIVINAGILIVVIAFNAPIVNAPVRDVSAGKLNVTSDCN